MAIVAGGDTAVAHSETAADNIAAVVVVEVHTAAVVVVHVAAVVVAQTDCY